MYQFVRVMPEDSVKHGSLVLKNALKPFSLRSGEMSGFDLCVIAKVSLEVDVTDGSTELSCNSSARCFGPLKASGNMCMGMERRLLCMTFLLQLRMTRKSQRASRP